MSRKYNNTDNEQQSDAHSSKFSSPRSLKILTKKHKQYIHKQPTNSNHYSFQNSSIVTSLEKLTIHQQKQPNIQSHQITFNEQLIPAFAQKYLPRGNSPQQIYEQMHSILKFKQKQIQSLIVYRDQLKFISHNNPYEESIKISIKLLQDKAQIQSKMKFHTYQMLQEIQKMQKQNQNIVQYTKIISGHKDCQYNMLNVNFIDMHKEKQLMIDNIKMQTLHFIKQLDNEKRKNQRQIKQIQDQIFNYRVNIKDKQDKIRELKAKVCTLYIKMHSRNPERSGSKDRNMSMSIRKFNIENNQTIKEVFIGNTEFKKFSKEMLQKITYKEELMKIKFFHKKEKLYFQCVYQNKCGILHYPVYDVENSRGGADYFQNTIKNDKNETKDKTKQLQLTQQVNLKYLMSIKFFFKSSLVGVQCRLKTDKGNKHLQIGNCTPNLQNELLTLVNRKLVTLGSYWHGKEMIGIAIWYKDQKPVIKRIQSTNRLKEKEKKMTVDTQDQYYA